MTKFLKNLFVPRTTEPISTKVGTKHSCVTGTQVFTNERIDMSQKGDVFIYINHRY